MLVNVKSISAKFQYLRADQDENAGFRHREEHRSREATCGFPWLASRLWGALQWRQQNSAEPPGSERRRKQSAPKPPSWPPSSVCFPSIVSVYLLCFLFYFRNSLISLLFVIVFFKLHTYSTDLSAVSKQRARETSRYTHRYTHTQASRLRERCSVYH